MLTTPSNRELPGRVDARKLTGQGVALAGFFSGAQLPRLSEAVVALPEPVDVELSFSADEQQTHRVTGVVQTTVTVICQRCMEEMPLPLRAEVKLGLVWNEEGANRLHKDLEPWIVAGESAPLSDLVEDELLLILPYVNYHDAGQCGGVSCFSTGEPAGETAGQWPNPFQVLEQLKGKK